MRPRASTARCSSSFLAARAGYRFRIAVAVLLDPVLIPFGSVDPLQGEAAIDEASRQADLGVRGFKFHPSVQAFDPSATSVGDAASANFS